MINEQYVLYTYIQDLPLQEPNSVDCGVLVCKIKYWACAVVLIRLSDKMQLLTVCRMCNVEVAILLCGRW